MKLPKIGDIITTEKALELCEYFKFDYLVQRIRKNPNKYKNWKFDGCSCLPDRLLGFLTGCHWLEITYQCALPHDLGYAYGRPNGRIERKNVDINFKRNLIEKAGMNKWIAMIFYIGVRIGGIEKFGFSFSWAFAYNKEN